MFRKPPLRTYGRKKDRGLMSASSVVREDIPKDKDFQPQGFLDFKDSDQSLEYDPFDTTFDRFLKDTQTKPTSADGGNDSFRTNDATTDSSDEDRPEPFSDLFSLENTRPPAQLRPYKKQRTAEEIETFPAEKKKKRLKGRARSNDSSTIENTDPNAAQKRPKKRGTKKKTAQEPTEPSSKKKRLDDKKLTPPSVKKNKNLNRSKNLKSCSVSLMRVGTNLAKSMKALRLKKNSTNDEQVVAEESVDPGHDEAEIKNVSIEESVDPAPDEAEIQNVSIEESVDPAPDEAEIQSVSVEENQTNDNVDNNPTTLKNSIVLLHRLSVPNPQKSAIDANWVSSTPIDPQIAKNKSSFHFSPIDSIARNEDNNSNDRRSSRTKTTANWKNSTPKNPKIAKPSNLNVEKNEKSSKNTSRLLGASPEPEPSRSMFSDTEIDDSQVSVTKNDDSQVSVTKNDDSHVSVTKIVDSQVSVPEDDDSHVSVTKIDDSQVSVTKIDDSQVSVTKIDTDHTTARSSVSSFASLPKESTDSESLRLIFNASDKSASSLDEISRSLEKTHFDATISSPKKSLPKNRGKSTNVESFEASAIVLPDNSEETTSKNRPKRFKENSPDRQISFDESAAEISPKNRKKRAKNRPEHFKENSPDRQISFDESAAEISTENREKIANDRENDSNESTNDRRDNFEECHEDTSKKSFSDDEWATISESHQTGDVTSEKSSKNTTVFGKSVVETTLDDDTEESVDNTASSSPDDSNDKELTSFRAEESSKFEAISESEAEADKSSINETKDEKSLKNLRRDSKQPIVLLSRINVPSTTTNVSDVTKMRNEIASDSIKSVRISINDDETIEKSANESEIPQEITEWQSSSDVDDPQDSQDSQDDTERSKTDEIEEPSVTEIIERDLSKGSRLWSLTELKNASDRSSLKNQPEDPASEDESSKTAEIEANASEIEETSMRMIEENRMDDQPIVLLTRLNDPIGITERRKKYRNWGMKTIVENPREKKVTTIEEEPEEDVDFDDSAIRDVTKKETIDEEPLKKSTKLSLGSSKKGVMLSQTSTVSFDASVVSNQGHDSSREDKVLYLKPGKSWSRSLSLFRQFQSQDDLEVLAVGKGKKWRQSVQCLMEMQPQGVIQSCVKKNEDDRESESCYGVDNDGPSRISGCGPPDGARVFGQPSIGSPRRFVRRLSICVVPDVKNSQHYEDTPFLEAYGITTSKNRKTFGKRSTLIAPKKTLLYNVQCQDVTFDSLPASIKSVTSRDVVLAQCGQDSSVPFDEYYPDSYLNHCRKIGEGVFGEVFLYEKGTTRSVIKIIPIEGDLQVNGERQKKFDEILSEIVIAKELNNLRFDDSCKTSSFVEVQNIRCVVGKYPRKLVDLWKTYDDEKNSENDCPDMFDKKQLYIVLELGHGGQDLEAFVFQNSSEAYALFVQTALALAIAEESLQFEHRDLHWGNLLISRTEDPHVDFKLHGKDITVPSKGVKVSVIDFTLSRMSYQGCSIFNDLSLDDDLFAAQGEYQFEIYRLMRQKVENNWQTFEPYTNVLWLHYTLDKMITAVRYRRTNSKIHKNGIEKLKELSCVIRDYDSAHDFVTNCDKVVRYRSRSKTDTNVSTD